MKLQRCLALGLAGTLIAGSSPSWGQAAGVALPADSRWQSTQGRSAESGFSRADQIAFNQVATQGRLEQLCRNIALSGNINQAFPSSEGGFSLGVLRRLVTLPSVEHPQNLELYQVDEYSPGISLTPSLELLSRVDESIGLGIGASFNLDSTVVRPRQFYKNCAELKDLLNVADIKLVLPPALLKHPTRLGKEEFVSVMAPRIAQMEDGELWSLSGLTTISATPSASFTTGHISAGVSIGGTQNGGAVMMVHRLSATRTRFSLRVSHLHVFNAQGYVSDVPIITLFRPGGAFTVKNELEKVFDGAVAGKLAEFFAARFSVLQQIGAQSSQQYLIAFDLDTSDPAQTAELAEMMQSDLIALLQKAVAMATLQATQKANLAHFDELTKKHEEVFGRAASVIQTDIGKIDKNHSATLKLPVLGTHSRAASATSDDVVTVTPNWVDGPAARELHLAGADRPKNDQGLSIPVINRTIASDVSDTKYTGFYFADNGKLQAVFTHQDAFQRRKASAVQDTLNEFRDMLAVTGSRGDPAADGKRDQYQIDLPVQEGRIKSGSLAFTMSLSAAGIEKAFNASEEEIKRSALRVFPLAPRQGGPRSEQGPETYDSSFAARIVRTLIEGKDQTPGQRNAALRDLMVAKGNSDVVSDSLGSFFSFLPFPSGSDMAYEGTMKVLLQLMDPQDVSANLSMNMNMGEKLPKGAKNPGVNISVNQSSDHDLIDAGLANRVRTAPPKYMDINQ
jgi:hypothetical protein